MSVDPDKHIEPSVLQSESGTQIYGCGLYA